MPDNETSRVTTATVLLKNLEHYNFCKKLTQKPEKCNLFSKELGRLIAEGKNQMVCISAEGKLKRFLPEFLQRLQERGYAPFGF